MTDLQSQYDTYKNQLQQLAQKVGDLETENDEHSLVIGTLQPLPPSRKCFRMIGGILVERTVEDVLPQLEANQAGLTSVMETLVKQYKSIEDQFRKFQKGRHVKDVWR